MPADPPGGPRVCLYGERLFLFTLSGGVWVHGSVCGCVGVIVSEGRRSPIVSDVVGRLGRLRRVGARWPARLCGV